MTSVSPLHLQSEKCINKDVAVQADKDKVQHERTI